MNAIADFIESGILEIYVLGQASVAESQEVEHMAQAHEEVRQELADIQHTVESYASKQAVAPSDLVKSELLAAVDFYERLQKGEEGGVPPALTENSRREDYAAWLNRADMVAPAEFSGVYAKLIGVTPQASTAIVWIRDVADNEIHHEQNERFLILEGTCTFQVGAQVYHLGPGDNFAVPLHMAHSVHVTSAIPCKAIVQRVAA